MDSFTIIALPFHCIISAWYWFLSHFFVCVCGCLLTPLAWSSCLHFYTYAFCSVLWNFRRRRLRLPAAFSHIAGITHYIWFTVKVAAVQNTIGEVRLTGKKKKRTDLVFLKSERTRPRNTQSSSLLFPSQGNEDRLSEFVWHVPLFLPVRSCRSTSAVHMEINCASPQLL